MDPGLIAPTPNSTFLCACAHTHEVLGSTHHLKHFSRLQYGLFLKGIVSSDDAMEFWRQEFTKVMDHEKFEKQYSYIFQASVRQGGQQGELLALQLH
ncbi:hypothetical protein NQ318_009531 [Aromia moschata]|uniref:DNA primase large subunit C-terminal domain-containing protein n=1 Tax=Aromia moschata TaxID=1265417 RepID=A0AAV8YA15_9CUCU|nr:hypothetical protein NQ318_009531 [Aromia moschata]